MSDPGGDTPAVETPLRVLHVDTWKDLRESLAPLLGLSAMTVRGAASAEEGRALLKEEVPDLILLSHCLPPTSGLVLCREFRAQADTARVPIVLLTADVMQEQAYLEAGADDFLQKGRHDHQSLSRRIRAAWRRARMPNAPVLRTDFLTLVPDRLEVLVDGFPLSLSPTEFYILYSLAAEPVRRFMAEDLWNGGPQRDGPLTLSMAIACHVQAIHEKLGPKHWLIQTHSGPRYSLGCPPAHQDETPPDDELCPDCGTPMGLDENEDFVHGFPWRCPACGVRTQQPISREEQEACPHRRIRPESHVRICDDCRAPLTPDLRICDHEATVEIGPGFLVCETCGWDWVNT